MPTLSTFETDIRLIYMVMIRMYTAVQCVNVSLISLDDILLKYFIDKKDLEMFHVGYRNS